MCSTVGDSLGVFLFLFIFIFCMSERRTISSAFSFPGRYDMGWLNFDSYLAIIENSTVHQSGGPVAYYGVAS